MHPYVIQEVATVLTYRFGNALAKKFIADISEGNNIVIPLIDIRDDMRYFISVTRKISFTDASLVNLTKKLSASLLTFDKQMITLFSQSKN